MSAIPPLATPPDLPVCRDALRSRGYGAGDAIKTALSSKALLRRMGLASRSISAHNAMEQQRCKIKKSTEVTSMLSFACRRATEGSRGQPEDQGVSQEGV